MTSKCRECGSICLHKREAISVDIPFYKGRIYSHVLECPDCGLIQCTDEQKEAFLKALKRKISGIQ